MATARRSRRTAALVVAAPLVWSCAAESTALLEVETDCEGAECPFDVEPSLGDCQVGVLSPAWQARAIDHLNRIRQNSGLNPVEHDPALDLVTASCALVNAGLDSVSHEPPPTATCMNDAAKQGCLEGNLTRFRLAVSPGSPGAPVSAAGIREALRTPEEFVESWLIDKTTDGNVGHRRWLLDPFMKVTSMGMAYRTSTGADGATILDHVGVLQVLPKSFADPGDETPTILAYPMGDYPLAWVDPSYYVSVSLLVDRDSPARNSAVNFESATVTVTKDGTPAPLATLDGGEPDLRISNEFFGLPNHLQFRLAEPLVAQASYAVVLDGVVIEDATGAPTDAPARYEYTFRLVP
ncbi:MAG: CAP domain-containing protein [Myxococcales bacterium]|nr:CAP domain-containing protein [Myxococcales bacterium]